MRDVTYDNFTDAVVRSIDGTADPRLKEVLSAVIRKAHELVKELDLTHEEWQAAMNFLLRTGAISDERRNEFILLSDLIGVSSLVDMIASKAAPGSSERSVLGPFYRENAPVLEIGGDLIKDNEGDRVVFQGHVRSTTGEPIAGALLDMWQNAANGQYENVDPSQPDYSLRCRMRTDAEGYYCYSSIRPIAYEVPDDGPGGEFMAATGRHCWRPAHLHARVSADGYGELVTEVFNTLDKYIDEDATFGVRESLAIPFDREPTEAELARHPDVVRPFKMVDFDFVLRPVG
jgi:protocatechuate 3,4-dioxygenase beta subunit